MSWNNAANWDGGVVPTASDDVVLDHTFVSNVYSVQLPGGAVTVSVHRLTVWPVGSPGITLVLPATNTANPGLKAGDALAGTDDIILGQGAVLINSSAASFGNGIEANSVANGTVRIDNGGRYVHNTLRAASGIAPLLSTAPGTELGVFEYDAPGTNTFNISASGRTYGSLTLTRTAGAATYGALGSSDWRVRGNLRINPGVSVSSTMTGALRLAGNFSSDGVQMALPPSQTAIFEATGVQVVSGASGLTLNGNAIVQPGTTLALNHPYFYVNDTLTVNGRLRIDIDLPPGGVGSFTYGAGSGELELNSPTTPLSLNSLNPSYWPALGGPTVVYVRGMGLSLEISRTVSQLLAVEAQVLGAQLLTISGTLERRAGASLSASPVYTAGGTLRYVTGASPGFEWVQGSTVGPGVPQHVVVDAGSGTVTLPVAGRTVPGDLSVVSGTLAYDSDAGSLSVRGAVSVDGALSTYGRPLTLDGSGLQPLSGPTALAGVPLRLAKSSGSVRLAGDVQLLAGLVFDGGAGDVLDLDGRVLALDGPVSGSNPGGVLRGSPLASLDVGPTGVSTPIAFASGGATLRRLRVDGPPDIATFSLASDLAVTDSLVLVSGRVATGPHAVTVAAVGHLDVSGGWVQGRMGRDVPAGPGTPLLFAVGDAGEYAPATLTFGSVSTAGVVFASTTPGDHPLLMFGSGIDGSHSVNRTWHLSRTGLAFDAFTAILSFPSADVDPGSDPLRFGIARYESNVWYPTTPGIRTATSTQSVGNTGFGDFAVGTLPSYTLSVTSGANGTVTVNPVRPTYTEGEIVRLTAVPASGYHLLQWSGDATGTINPLDVVMTANKSITATFAINRYALDVAIVGSGTVAKNPDSLTYAHGSSVTLTAMPAPHWHFKSWSGSVTSTTNPLPLTVTAPISLTATFEIDSFAVSVSSSAGGTITKVPDRAFYAYGDTTTLTAIPDPSHHFVTWGGDATGSTNPLVLAVDAAKSITATFVVNSYALTTPVVGNGTVGRSPNQAQYDHGTAVTLTAAPGTDYHFVGWSGDTTTTTNPISFVITAPRTITATFAIDTRTLTITVNGAGAVLRDPDLTDYPVGSSVQLTAVPDPGQVFAGWGGDAAGFANPITILMSANRAVTANFEPNTPKYWTGQGDGVSWSDGLNWIRGTPPVTADEVILDNGTITGNYTVNLPAGSATVNVHRLSVRPAPTRTITLTLPAANTANPGMAVGDSLAGTDDIIIGPGGVIVNGSGASAGNGIQASTVGNGTVRIENGGRYMHASLRSPGGVAPMLLTTLGTEQGVFEYDVPGTGSYNLSLSGRTYGKLVLTRSAGPGTYGALGTSNCRVRGAFRTNAGVTFSSSMSGTLQLEGGIESNGAPLNLSATQPLLFQGPAVQTISGSSSVQVLGTTTIANGATLTLTSTPFGASGTVVVNGALRLVDGAVPGGGGAYVYDSVTGTLEFFTQSSPYSIGASGYWPTANAPAFIRVLGTGASFTAARTVTHTLSVQAPLLNAGLLTVNGTLELAAGGSVSGAPVYASGSLLRYTSPRTVGQEWGPGQVLGAGVPANVEVAAPSGVVQQGLQNRMVTGNLTLTSGTYRLDALGGDLLLAGNLSGAGTLNTNGRALMLKGSGLQTLSSTGPLAIDYLRLERTSGQVNLLVDVTLKGSAGNVLEFNGSGDFLGFDGRTLTLQGPVGGSNPNGRLLGTGGSSMVLSGSGDMGSLAFLDGYQVLTALTVNISGTNPTVALGSWLTVTTSLSLQNGMLASGNNLLTLLNGASVTRTNGYVQGLLAKQVSSGAGVAVNFEVGNGGYAPVGLVFHQVTAPGTVRASTTTGDHPNLGSTSLDAQHSVNRWWTVYTGDASFDSCAATFGFSPADLDPGSDPLGFDVRRYTGTWAGTTPGAHTATSTTASGITAFGDFAVAKPLIYTLALSAAPGGSATKAPDYPIYDAGTVVTVTATNDPGYHFTGWSGDASGTTNPLTVVMNSDQAITANFQLNGPKQWLGTTAGGDGVTWASGLNWTDGAAPVASEEVVLDNTYVTGTYVLTSPAGTTTIKRLTILPSVGRTITLTLPATNTAVPGLQVGDSVGSTDDIVLNPGAVLKNSSGAASGGGIALASGNGTLRISSGARFVHNTQLAATSLTTALSTAAGTETGEFEYDVPGTASFVISAASRTYGSLTLTRSAGPATYTATGSTPLTVRGALKTNPNVTFTSSMTGALNLAGDLTINGAALTTPSGQTVNFNGNGVQVVTGAVAITLSGPSTVASGTTLAINAPSFLNNGTMTISGALQINQGGIPGGSGTYAYTASVGTLIFNNTTSLISVPNNPPYWPSSGSPANVTVQGAGGISLGSPMNRTVPGLLKIGASLQRANVLTVTGTLQMNAGGVITTSAPTYSGTPTLAYTAGLTVGLEWGPGSVVGSGVPAHVVVSVGTVNLPNSDRNVVGNLTISSGAALVCNPSQGNLIVRGNLTVDGALTSNGRSVQFAGGAVQTVSGAVPLSLSFVVINKSAGSVQLLTDLTVTGTTGTGLAFNGSAGDVLFLGARTLTIAGTIGGTDASGRLSGIATSTLVLNADGAIGTIQFAAGGRALKHLTLGGASPTLTLASVVTINGTLTLGSGRITSGANTITMASGGAVTRTTGFVIGNLGKAIGTGSGVGATFEVGTGTTYAPAVVSFGNVTTAGNLTVSTTAGEHPQLVTSGLDGTQSVNRYWTLTNGGLAFNQYSATFNYVSDDVDASADPSAFQVSRYSASAWNSATVGTRTSTSTQATGLTGFGDFAIATPAMFTITLSTVGNGSASATPNLAQYSYGTLVVLTGTPNSGNSFVTWSGDTTTTTNPLTIRVTKNRVLTANFTFTLTTNVSGSGSVTRNPNQSAYAPGTVVALTAVPITGWHFVGWSGDTTTTTNPISLAMTSNRNVTATFAINTYTVTLSTVGNGTAAKTPDQATYNHGSTVTLTATPNAGNSFVSWSGDTATTTNPLSIVVTRNRAITANFTYTLTTNVSGTGSVTRNPNQSAYAPGTVVSLTAVPGSGWHFLGWSGDTTTTANPISLAMTSNRTVTATFAINTYTVTLSTVGNGTAAKSPDQATYNHGSTVTLTATPNAGNSFVSWSGDTAATTNPLSIVVTRNRALTANFTYTLTTSVSGNGTVAVNPNQTAFAAGSVVTLTATPFIGWSFTGWSGDTTTTTNPLTLVMTRNRSLIATFALNSYTVTLSTVGNGTATRNPSQATYPHGSTVTLTGTPNAGNSFVSWSGDTAATTNPLAIVVTRNRTLTANFTYTLTTSVSGNGTVVVNPNQTAFAPGSVVTLTATPSTGWNFAGWSGDTTTATNPLTLVLTRNRSLIATFALNNYALAVTTSGSGNVNRNPNLPSYPHGTAVTLTATPSANWHFTGWSGDTTAVTNPLSLVMTRDRNLTATFALDEYTLVVTVAGSGSVARNPSLASYPHGTAVSVTATPSTNWHFTSWTGDTAAIANPLSLVMTRNRSLTATFMLDQYALTVGVTGSGSVTKNPNLPAYDHGTEVTLTATPAAHWHFTGWSGDTTAATNPLTLVMTHNRSLTATFAIDTFTLAVSVIGNGTVSRNPDLPTYPYGTVVTLTATPATGHHFVGWSGDTASTANPLLVGITRDRAITATFAIDTHTLTVNISGSGSVTRSPDLPAYDYGTVVKLTAVPASNWHFAGWSGDLTGQSNPDSIAMLGNRQVTAQFVADAYPLTVTVTGKGAVVVTPNQPTYPAGSNVNLSAQPAPGWTFMGWGGDVSGTTNPIGIVITHAMVVVAMFADQTPPSVQVLQPNGGDTLSVGDTLTVEWSASDLDGVQSVDLWLVRPGSPDSLAAIATGISNSGALAWTVPSPAVNEAYVRVIVRDTSGNATLDQSDNPFDLRGGLLDSPVGDGLPLALLPPMPNPAVGRLRLGFTLPRATRVRLVVVDVTGREVARLVEGQRSPGRHEVVWEQRGGRAAAPPGIYFARLDVGGEQRVRRFVLAP